jgi:hypothetical protein
LLIIVLVGFPLISIKLIHKNNQIGNTDYVNHRKNSLIEFINLTNREEGHKHPTFIHLYPIALFFRLVFALIPAIFIDQPFFEV